MNEYIKKSEAVDVIVKYPYNIAGKTATAIKMIENLPSADVVPKSEVERLQAELEDKQFRCDSCDRIGLTHSEHIYCIKQAKAEVASEIFAEIERLMLDGAIGGKYPAKVINPDKYAELKKKYTE